MINERLIKNRKRIDRDIKFLLTNPKAFFVLQTINKEHEYYAKNLAIAILHEDAQQEQKIDKVLYSMDYVTALQFLKAFTVKSIWYAITHIFKKD